MSFQRIDFGLKRTLKSDDLYWPKAKLDDKKTDTPKMIKAVKNLQHKLAQIRQVNETQYKIFLNSAKEARLNFNEFGELILCKVKLEPEGDWHDYSLIEDSIGPLRAVSLVQQGRYELNPEYHMLVTQWKSIILPILLKIDNNSYTYNQLMDQIMYKENDSETKVATLSGSNAPSRK